MEKEKKQRERFIYYIAYVIKDEIRKRAICDFLVGRKINLWSLWCLSLFDLEVVRFMFKVKRYFYITTTTTSTTSSAVSDGIFFQIRAENRRELSHLSSGGKMTLNGHHRTTSKRPTLTDWLTDWLGARATTKPWEWQMDPGLTDCCLAG